MRYILPVIVVAQFFCTSLWFAGNAIVSDIAGDLNLDAYFIAHLTSAIQFGFISGTLVFAIFTLSDRFSPSKVFFCSAVLASFFNLGMSLENIDAKDILFFRFATGFFLAGIYPVGMKIASDYYQKGLGKSLGFLVGALVLGTAFPHLLKSFIVGFPWRYVLYGTTLLSVAGGLGVVLLVPKGPYCTSGQKMKLTACMSGFKNSDFRSASFGYFGHMWELYTFWAFVPIMLASYNIRYPETHLNVSLLSFLIIASGGVACVISGMISQSFGAKKIASLALFISCICCLISPLFLFAYSPSAFIIFLFIWGLAVIADSPLFSTLVAQSAPEVSRGTSLTIVNCIGFAITIVSLQCIHLLSHHIDGQFMYVFLAIGPVFGLIALRLRSTDLKYTSAENKN